MRRRTDIRYLRIESVACIRFRLLRIERFAFFRRVIKRGRLHVQIRFLWILYDRIRYRFRPRLEPYNRIRILRVPKIKSTFVIS